MDGEPPQEEDFSQIPIIERSQHKASNWKARVSAYTDVISKSAKTASDTDPFFRPYVSDGSLLKKWCLDANAVAQEKGIEAVTAIVQYSGESSARQVKRLCRSDVVPALVDKSLGAARAGTKKKGAELCAMFVEVENTGEGVMTDVLVGLDSKQPKVVAGSVSALKDVVEAFGVQSIGNIKPLLKVLSKIFAHSDKTVRAEGTSLVLVLYAYLGPALLPSLGDLKPVQMAELQKSFNSMDAEGKGAGSGKPTRWTRKVQREREAAQDVGGGNDAGEAVEEEAAPIDPRSLLDPVNVLSLFPSDLDERLTSSKWKDRLESLEECNKVLAQPQNARVADSNVDAYGSLVQTLGAKCKSDANVNVVIEAAKLLEGLARGIGKPFGRYRAMVMSGCLERLKERKATVVEALGKALDAVSSTTTLSEIVEDVLAQMKSKNPQVREHTLKFLHRSLQTTLDAPGKDQVKPLAEALVALLGDSVEAVRTSAADCLGTMMKILGERAFNPYIENVGELQMAKVKDAFAKAEIKYRGGAKGPAPKSAPSAAPAKKAPIARPAGSPPIKSSGKFNVPELVDEFAPPSRAPPARFAAKAAPKDDGLLDEFAPPAKAPPARFAAKAPPKATSSAPSSPPKPTPVARKAPAAAGPSKPTAAARPAGPAGKAGPSKTLAVSPSEPVKYRYSSEDAAAQAADIIPSDIQTKLADAAWKVRLEAAEELVKWVEEEGGAEKIESEVMMRFLGKTPGWGEKNFQVSAKLYQVMGLMAEQSPSFGKPAAALCIGPLSDKLGDLKLKKPAGDALTIFAEKTSLAFVLAQAYEPMTKQKAPKAQADALVWIKQQLTDFGIAGIPLRDLISFVKGGLGSPNALVRSSATQVLVTVKIFVGADISGFLEDLNPQLLSTINSEFDKVSGQTPPEPSKNQADLQEAASGPTKAGGKSGGADPLDDLIPRVDLDKLVNQTSVIADSRSDAWKTRKEAFEALAGLLEIKSNSRLKPNMGEIGGVLKKAMADTNLSVKMLALGIISKIATGMGQPFDKYTRLLIAPIASVCADQKATTRSAALATLSAVADACGGLDGMYGGLATSLETTNPALRSSVLGWMAERLQAEPPTASSDLAPLAGPIISCLEDRNGDVRKGAGTVLPFVVASAGFDHVMDQTSNLKPASRATIIPLINNAKASAPASAPAAVAPSRAPPSAPAVKPTKAPAPRSAPGSPAPAAIPTIKPPARSLAMKALSSAPSTRPTSGLGLDDRPSGLPKPRTIPRPASAASQPPSTASSTTFASSSTSRVAPFVTSSLESRTARQKKDAVRWVLDSSPKPELTEYLQSQMEPHVTPELFAQLFSKDRRAEEDFMAALSGLADFYSDRAISSYHLPESEVSAIQLANVDLTLKYAAVKLLSNNTQMAMRCLEVIGNVVDTMQKLNERFSDAEAKLFVPALIFKLGDAKFGAKLMPIFDSLDKVIPGSQLVQLLVQFGLEDKSAGKTCKNESLALIEKAYRKRGSILRTRDDRSFYEVVAKCISDSGTRNAALSVMALLQLQGGSKSLEAVIEGMPQGSKDMLANRKATMAAARSGAGGPLVAKASAEALATSDSPSRLPRPGAVASPGIPPRGSSPAIKSPIPRKSDSPRSRLAPPSKSSPAPSRGIPAPSGALRAATSALPTQSRLQRPSDVFGGKLSLQPLNRGTSRPSNEIEIEIEPPSPPKEDPLMSLINEVQHDDLNRVVDSLKVLQQKLDENADAFRDNVQTLTDTLMDAMDRAFSPPENLRDSQYFRLVKHLIQTVSAVTSNQDLMRRLSYDHVYAVISGLSLHLVQADRLGGHVSELSRFINMILVQTLSTTERQMVFRAMFSLLFELVRDFEVDHTPADSAAAAHADLVIKCLWKRCKVLDDDFRTGRLRIGPLLRVLEDFVQQISPSEFRRRAMEGVAMGDMPLRTVKTVLQKMVAYGNDVGLEIYDELLAEFGENAANTIVYSYIFRLAGHESTQPPGRSTPAVNGSSHERTSSSRPRSAASQVAKEETAPTSAEASPPAQVETEAERLVRKLIRSNNQSQQLDDLYHFVKTIPEAEGEVQAVLSAKLSAPVQTYVRRMLEQRRAEDHPSPSRHDNASPIRSPARPDSVPARAMARKSFGPRPSSVAIDKSAPVDEQISHIKNIFSRGGAGAGSGSGSGAGSFEASASPPGQGQNSHGRPLSEISPPGQNLDVD